MQINFKVFIVLVLGRKSLGVRRPREGDGGKEDQFKWGLARKQIRGPASNDKLFCAEIILTPHEVIATSNQITQLWL